MNCISSRKPPKLMLLRTCVLNLQHEYNGSPPWDLETFLNALWDVPLYVNPNFWIHVARFMKFSALTILICVLYFSSSYFTFFFSINLWNNTLGFHAAEKGEKWFHVRGERSNRKDQHTRVCTHQFVAYFLGSLL